MKGKTLTPGRPWAQDRVLPTRGFQITAQICLEYVPTERPNPVSGPLADPWPPPSRVPAGGLTQHISSVCRVYITAMLLARSKCVTAKFMIYKTEKKNTHSLHS